jgi:ubiquitin C-terminal hydrolase
LVAKALCFVSGFIVRNLISKLKMSTWLGGLFGKSKPKRADLSKLSDEEVSE